MNDMRRLMEAVPTQLDLDLGNNERLYWVVTMDGNMKWKLAVPYAFHSLEQAHAHWKATGNMTETHIVTHVLRP